MGKRDQEARTCRDSALGFRVVTRMFSSRENRVDARAISISLALALTAILTSPAAASDFSCNWTTGASGTWNVASNWSTCNSTFPNNSAQTYDATIAATGTYTVTLNSTVLLNNLTINAAGATLNQTASTLTIAAGGIINIQAGTYRLASGTLVGGTVQQSATGSIVFSNGNNTLNGVTINGTLNVADSTGGVRWT